MLRLLLFEFLFLRTDKLKPALKCLLAPTRNAEQHVAGWSLATHLKDSALVLTSIGVKALEHSLMSGGLATSLLQWINMALRILLVPGSAVKGALRKFLVEAKVCRFFPRYHQRRL